MVQTALEPSATWKESTVTLLPKGEMLRPLAITIFCASDSVSGAFDRLVPEMLLTATVAVGRSETSRSLKVTEPLSNSLSGKPEAIVPALSTTVRTGASLLPVTVTRTVCVLMPLSLSLTRTV